jgi:hypothetical protein
MVKDVACNVIRLQVSLGRILKVFARIVVFRATNHKLVNFTKDKGNSEKRVQKETRKCYNCKVGHPSRDCTKKSTDTAFVGCILTKKVLANNDKENNENDEVDSIKEIG